MAAIIQFPLVHDDNDPVRFFHRINRFSGMIRKIKKKDIAFLEIRKGQLVFTTHSMDLKCDEIIRDTITIE